MKERYHYFDFLRAIAILLGLPLHACLAYGKIEYHWLVKDVSHSMLIDIMLDYLRLFRMPLFFIISGFFSHLTIHKGEFLEKRTKRLLIPMLIFFVLLIIPLKALWLIMEVPEKLFSLDLNYLIVYVKENFLKESTPDQFRHSPNWGHLWFLMYLYVFSIMSIPFKKLKIFIIKGPGVLISLSMVLTLLSYFLMKKHWVDEPFYLYPIPSLLIYYGIFYFFGWQLFNFKDLSLGKGASFALVIGGSLLALLRSTLEVNSHFHFLSLEPNWLIYSSLAVLSTWSLALGFIFSFKELFNKENTTITYLVDGSYFIYLIHLPIIIFLQVLFSRLELSWILKFPLVTLLSLLFSLVLYKFIVRDKMIDRLLKGNY